MLATQNAAGLARRGLGALLAAALAPGLALSLALGLALPGPTFADEPVTAAEINKLVEDARISLERLEGEAHGGDFKRRLSEARGVLIVPELIKGGFILGAEGGTGVLLVRGADGTWSAPAFYTLGAGSLGIQAGVQISEVVFTVMTEGALEALLSDELKLGADASVAVGPLGAGVEASSTTNLGADIYAFSRAVGLFGGGAIEGGKIIPRQDWNDTYYGAPAPARAVVIERKFFNPQADPLRQSLARGGGSSS